MLHGKTVTLRPLTVADAPDTLALRMDVEANKAFMGYIFPVTEANERRWLESLYADGPRRRVDFAIVNRETKEFLGLIAVTDMDALQQRARFGVFLRREARGQGVAPDAMAVFFDYVFRQLNIARVWLEVLADNAPAVKLYESFGFVEEGTMRRHHFQDGVFKDVKIMGLLREEFQTRA
ncbi:MAG TPA: GNAT family protein [Thermoanaerobaculia bacterium]|jgi:RimJ/RimL family protein N-acetyltransferase